MNSQPCKHPMQRLMQAPTPPRKSLGGSRFLRAAGAVLGVLLLAGWIPVGADQPVVVSVGEYGIDPGGAICAPVDCSDLSSHFVLSCYVELRYDGGVICCSDSVEPQCGSVWDNGATLEWIEELEPGGMRNLKIYVISGVPASGTGSLVEVTFDAQGWPGDSTDVMVDCVLNEGTPEVTCEDGCIWILETVQGMNRPMGDMSQPALMAYPNPTRQMPHLRLDLPSAGPVDIRLIGPTGRLVWHSHRYIEAGRHWFLPHLAQRLATGRWFCQVVAGDVTLRSPILVLR